MYKAVIVAIVCGLALAQATPCQDALLAAKTLQLSQSGGGRVSIPQCEADGSFSAKQCNLNSGTCYCVDLNGTRISDFTRGHLHCACIRARDQAQNSKLYGVYAPQCDRFGHYKTMQCYERTQQCWCSTPQGKALSQGRGDLKTCDCIIFRNQQRLKVGVSFGLAHHQVLCEENGNFNPIQFFPNRFAMCVDGQGHPVTKPTFGLSSCHCILHKNFVAQQGLLHTFSPVCESNGDYSPYQCFEGKCWCVRPDGTVFAGATKISSDVCRCYRDSDIVSVVAALGVVPPMCV